MLPTMSNFTSRCSFGVMTVLIALTISHVMGFQQRFPDFQRSFSSCRPSDNHQEARGRCGSTSLFMGKFRNKQAELQRKMALAKQQAAQKASENDDDGSSSKGAKARMSDEELKEANDRKRFDELLNSQSASIGAKSSDSYLTQEQEEENIEASRKFRMSMPSKDLVILLLCIFDTDFFPSRILLFRIRN